MCLASSVLISSGLCGLSADNGSGGNTLWSCCEQSHPPFSLLQRQGLQVRGTGTWQEERAPGAGPLTCVHWGEGLELWWVELPLPCLLPWWGPLANRTDTCQEERAPRAGFCMQLPGSQNRAEQTGGSPPAYTGVKFDFTAGSQVVYHCEEPPGCVACEGMVHLNLVRELPNC